ncbi:hypothetical protein [Effusibacillus consociatus]|uniref:Uncharacterized protein n=1 Tax=Effusibacillus consociatus TaxID=1117041 RepID=A0ABV9Q0W6_9BACL
MKIKKFISVLLTGAFLLTSASISSAAPANTDKIPLTPQDEQRIIQNMKESGVDDATQKKLIGKLKNGEKWDSMKPELLEQAKKEVNITPTSRETKYTFPDGSAIIQSISGGTVSCGTGYCVYTNMKVSEQRWYVGGSFKADFTILNGSNDYISKVYDASIWSFGTVSSDTLTLDKSQEDLSGPAQATLRWVGYNGVTSATFILRLKVGGNNYWDEANY